MANGGPSPGDVGPGGEIDIDIGPIGDSGGGGGGDVGDDIDVGDVDGGDVDGGTPGGPGRTGPGGSTTTGEPVVDEGDTDTSEGSQSPSGDRSGSATDAGPRTGGGPAPGAVDASLDRQRAGDRIDEALDFGGAGTDRGRTDMDPDQIARDVGAAFQRGGLEGSEPSAGDRRRALAEAKRERGGPAEPFRPDAPQQGSIVREVGDGSFVVSLATPTGREIVPVAFAGPRTGPRNLTGPREAVAPFEESEAEKIIDGRRVDRLEGFERAEFREQTASNLTEVFGVQLGREDVDLEEQDGRVVATPTGEAREEIQQAQLFGQLQEATPETDLSRSDVEFTDEGARLREGVAGQTVGGGIARQQAVQRRAAAEKRALRNLETRLEIATGVTGGPRAGDVRVDPQDLERGEDFTVERRVTDDGSVSFGARLTDAFLIEQAADQLDQPGWDPGEGFLTVRDPAGPETQAAADAVADAFGAGGAAAQDIAGAFGIGGAAAETAAGTFEIGGAAAETVADEVDDRRVVLTPRGRRSLIRTRVAEEGGDIDELRFDEQGRVREPTREERLEEMGFGERLAQPVIGPKGPGFVGDAERTLGGVGAGTFEAVAGPPGGAESFAGDIAPDFLHEGTDAVGEGVSGFVQGVEQSGPVQEAIGPAGSHEEAAVGFFEDAGDFLQRGVQPTADVFGDIAELGTRLSPHGTVLGLIEGDPVGRAHAAAADVLRGPEQEEAGGIVETGTTGITAGVGSLTPFAARSPTFVQGVGEQAFESSAAAASQNPAESAVEAGEFTEQTARRVATQTARNPLETAGMLIGTGGAFAAARSVGARTSLATRALLQPGEELIGKGGAAAFRGGAGAARRAGATRTAAALKKGGRTLFPRGEPLFASEEAAIMAGQRAVETARRGRRAAAARSGRLTAAAPAGVGAPRGFLSGVQFEVDPESRLIESEVGARETFLERPAGAVRRAGGRVRRAPGRARSELSEQLASAESRFRTGIDRTVRARQRAAERVAEIELPDGGRGVEGFDSMLRGLETGAPRRSDLPSRPSRPELNLGQRLTMAGLRAGEAGRSARRAPGRARSRLASDIEATRRRFEAGFERAEAGAEQAALRVAHTGPTISGDVALQQAFLRGSPMPRPGLADVGRVTGPLRRGIGRGRERLEAGALRVAHTGPTVSGDVALQQAFLRGSAVPGPGRPTIEFPDVVGGTRRETASLRFALGETREGVRETAADLRDLTIRIGGERRTIFEGGELGEPPLRFQGDMLGIEADTTVESEESDFEPLEPTEIGESETEGDVMLQGETGVAVQRVIQTETDAETEADAETTAEPGRTELGPEQAGIELPTVEEIARMDFRDVTGQPLRFEPLMEFGAGSEERLDSETRLAIETDRELDLEREAEREMERELERELEREREEELERELELELEREFEFELFPRQRPDTPEPEPDPSRRQIGRPDALDADVGADWWNEWVAGVAFGPGPREAPSQEALEARPDAEGFVGTRPIAVQVEGTEAEQEAFEETAAALTFGAAGGTDTGGGTDLLGGLTVEWD